MNNKLTIFLLAVLSTTLCSATFLLFQIEYTDFVVWLAGFLGYADHIERFAEIGFTLYMYQRLRWLITIYTLLVIGLLALFVWRGNCFFVFFSGLLKDIKQRFKLFFNIQAYTQNQLLILTGLLLLIVGSRCFLIIKIPLHIDEIHNYLYFTARGFLVAVSYYQEPNNHIFYTLTTVILSLFTDNVKLLMRLPSLLAHLFTVFILLRFLLKYVSFSLAVLGVIWFSFSDLSIYYSSIGRGYALQTLFVLLAFCTTFQFKKAWAATYFVVISTLGLYTIPTFLYPFFAFLILLGVNKKSLKSVIYIGLMTSFLTFLLYSPIIALNGLEALTQNRWVQSLSWNDWLIYFPSHWAEWQRDIWNIYTFWGFLPVLFITLLLMISWLKKRQVIVVRSVLMAYWIPFFVLLLQHTLPPTRVWSFLVLFAAMSIVFAIKICTENYLKWQKWLVILLVPMCLLRSGFHFYIFLKQEISIYKVVEQNIIPLALQHQPQHIFSNEDVSIMHFLLQKQQHKITAQLHTHQLDTLQHYDFLVWDKQKKIPPYLNKLYTTCYEDEFVLVKKEKLQ
jgi:hypothetical protein